MADLAVGAGAISIAHGVHYAVLGTGLLGLVWLLAPGRRTVSDEHALRVQALREVVAAGNLGLAHPPTIPPTSPVREKPALEARLWLPVALTSCAAAAGVHAAVGPEHFREKTVLGLFFALAAVAQMAWSVALAVRPERVLLRWGTIDNVALVALWAVTRTIGLPGLAREPVGPWDLSCVTWELVAAFACLQALAAHSALGAARVAGWADWDARARLWALLSVVGLGLLSISGAAS